MNAKGIEIANGGKDNSKDGIRRVNRESHLMSRMLNRVTFLDKTGMIERIR